MNLNRFITVDEEGYFAFDGVRVTDPEAGRELIKNVRPVEGFRFASSLAEKEALIESFDEPYVARHIEKIDGQKGVIQLAYEEKAEFNWSTLSVDEWDRFHGVTLKEIPFVLSRQAQVELFDQLDEFDDDSITVAGQSHSVGPWIGSTKEVNENPFWTNIYENETPGWELGAATPVLPSVLPQLKLSRAKVLVLGCGSGHDAAFLAKAGHVVTAIDFSPAAIKRAKEQYGNVENLTFLEQSAFDLPEAWNGQYDLIFEHTFYCAIDPERRNELVKTWRRLLAPGGHLLGVFFVHEKRQGPPFGGSEWEVRQRLKSHFDFLYWTRWRASIERRQGCELVLFARYTGGKPSAGRSR